MPVGREKIDTRLFKDAKSLAPIHELAHKPELCKEHQNKGQEGGEGYPAFGAATARCALTVANATS